MPSPLLRASRAPSATPSWSRVTVRSRVSRASHRHAARSNESGSFTAITANTDNASCLLVRSGEAILPGEFSRGQRINHGRAMSQENVEVVAKAQAVFAEGGMEAGAEFLADDVAFSEPPEQPGATTFHGLRNVLEGFGRWSENWASQRSQLERIIVAVVLRESGRGKGGGVELTNRWGQVDDGTRRQDRPHDGLSDTRGRPRSRRAVGVGDVEGEMGTRKRGR